MTTQLSDYERTALDDIREWKNPASGGWFGQTMKKIGWPLDKLGVVIKKAAAAAGVHAVLDKALAGTAEVLGNAAAWTVSPETVYAEFRKAGHDVHGAEEVSGLDLEQIDKVVGWLDVKYKGLAFAEGAAAGAAGVPELVLDIPALVTLNLRAIAEYATYYGFDVASQRERLFAMHVLGLASSPSVAAKADVMAQLAKLAADAAKKKTWKELEKGVLAAIIQKIAKALGIRLTKAKLAQAVPIMGAAFGGGFNAYYTARVCDAAWHLYRERFLAHKYNRPDVIDIDPTSRLEEGEEFEPRYAEADEELPAAE